MDVEFTLVKLPKEQGLAVCFRVQNALEGNLHDVQGQALEKWLELDEKSKDPVFVKDFVEREYQLRPDAVFVGWANTNVKEPFVVTKVKTVGDTTHAEVISHRNLAPIKGMKMKLHVKKAKVSPGQLLSNFGQVFSVKE